MRRKASVIRAHSRCDADSWTSVFSRIARMVAQHQVSSPSTSASNVDRVRIALIGHSLSGTFVFLRATAAVSLCLDCCSRARRDVIMHNIGFHLERRPMSADADTRPLSEDQARHVTSSVDRGLSFTHIHVPGHVSEERSRHQ